MTTKIEIHTVDNELKQELFIERPGNEPIDLGQGVSLLYDGNYIRKAFGLPEIGYFLLQFGQEVSHDVVVAVVSGYLVHKLHGKATVVIDRTEVELDEGKIKRILSEHIEKGAGDEEDE